MTDNEKKTVEVIIRGQQANASLREIQAAARILNAELKKLPVNSEEFKAKAKELQQVNTRLKSITDDIKGVGVAWKNIAAGFAVGNIIYTSLNAIKSGFQDSMRLHREFEASLKNLQAITGVSSKDLEFYSERAKEMGVSVQGGARAVVEAFKLIGSAKPELLQDKDAMNQVTEAAILLSKAAGLELPDASIRLTDALNQFGAPASAAAKYVDILAAAAKFGAAEVPDVTDALLKFGVAAKSSNISIQESAAVIELLAEKGLKGADAGTQLRNVFAKMSAADVLPKEALAQLERAGVDIRKLADNSIPLQQRLKELSKIQGDAGAITKVFGLENKIAGEVLISNLPRLEQLTKQVDENGAAQLQAAINTDTETQRLIEQDNRIDLISQNLGSKLAPAWGTIKEIALSALEGIVSGFEMMFSSTARFKDELQHMGATSEQVGRLMKLGLQDSWDDEKLQSTVTTIKILDGAQKRLIEGLHSGKISTEDYNTAIQSLKAQMLAQEVTTNSGATKFYLLKDAVNKLKKEYESFANVDISKTETVADDLTTAQIKARKKANDEILKANQKLLDDIANQKVAAIIDDELREKAKAELDNARRNTEIQTSVASEQIKSQALEAQKEIHEKAIQEIEWKYKQQRAANHDEYLKAKAERDKQAKQDELDLFKEEAEQMDQINRDNINKTFNDIIQANEQMAAERQKNKQLILSESRQLELDLSYTIFSAQQARIQREKDIDLQASDAKHNSETASLQARLTAGKITQEQFDRQKLASDQRFAAEQLAIKKAAFDQEKKMKIAQVGTNLIIELSNDAVAASQNPLNGVTAGAAGIAQFAVMAGLATARAAIQVAAISAQKFAAGGFNKTSNNPQGYTNGATLFTNSASGAPFIAGEEGEEWIAPNWMLENPRTAPVIQHLEAIRQTRGFAIGGSNAVTNTAAPVFEKPQSSQINDNSNLAYQLQRLNNILDGGIEAYLDYDRFTRDQSKIDNSKSSARIG